MGSSVSILETLWRSPWCAPCALRAYAARHRLSAFGDGLLVYCGCRRLCSTVLFPCCDYWTASTSTPAARVKAAVQSVDPCRLGENSAEFRIAGRTLLSIERGSFGCQLLLCVIRAGRSGNVSNIPICIIPELINTAVFYLAPCGGLY